MRSRLYLMFMVFALMLTNCASSSFPTNDEGVIHAQPSQINKDAIRLKGKVLAVEKVGDRLAYRIQVLEVIQYGSTFAHAEPETSETIVLYAPSEVKLKRNSEAIFDAIAPINRGEGMLELNMVIE